MLVRGSSSSPLNAGSRIEVEAEGLISRYLYRFLYFRVFVRTHDYSPCLRRYHRDGLSCLAFLPLSSSIFFFMKCCCKILSLSKSNLQRMVLKLVLFCRL